MLRRLGVVVLLGALAWLSWPAAPDPSIVVAPHSPPAGGAAAPEAVAAAPTERQPASSPGDPGEAAARPAPPAESTTLRIHGEVVDGLGQPLPACALRCELRDAAGAVVHTIAATSGADGGFTASAPSPTAVRTVVATVADAALWARPAREVLPPGALETSSLRVVCYPRDSVLRGHVEDTAGRPIAGARVGVMLRGTEVACDAAGAFELAVASSLRIVSLYAVAPGFAVAAKEVPIAPAETKTVTLVLAAGVLLTGRVVDADGRAVADAVVSTSWTMNAVKVVTDADGRFELPGVEVHAARQQLRVVHPDHVPWQDYLVVSGPRHLEITLARGAVVVGDVHDADGAVAAATITLTPVRGGEPRTAHSDERGAFTVRGLATGAHTVEVRARARAKHVGVLDVAAAGP